MRGSRAGRIFAVSYDLHVWSVRPFEHQLLRRAAEWKQSSGGDCTFARGEWQIVINSSDKVLPEDVPEEVAGAFAGDWVSHGVESGGEWRRRRRKLLLPFRRRKGGRLPRRGGARGDLRDPREGMRLSRRRG